MKTKSNLSKGISFALVLLMLVGLMSAFSVTAYADTLDDIDKNQSGEPAIAEQGEEPAVEEQQGEGLVAENQQGEEPAAEEQQGEEPVTENKQGEEQKTKIIEEYVYTELLALPEATSPVEPKPEQQTGVTWQSAFPDSVFRETIMSKIGVGNEEESAQISSKSLKKMSKVKSFAISNKPCSSTKGIEYLTELETLTFTNCGLTSIDLSANKSLKVLIINQNGFKELDLSENKALEHLECHNCNLAELDLSKNMALKYLDCYENKLNKLDVSNNTALTQLSCNDNNLEELDLRTNTALDFFDCRNASMEILYLIRGKNYSEMHVMASTKIIYGSADKYTLTFNTNGGNAIAAVEKLDGTKIVLSKYNNPTKANNNFTGWYLDEALTKSASTVELITNTTVYAKWGAVSGSNSKKHKDTAKTTTSAISVQEQPVPLVGVLPFTDVSKDYWAYTSILECYTKGYFVGKTVTIFDPDAPMTFEQMWMVLARISGEKPANMEAAKQWAVAKGISDGTDPKGNVTNEQFITQIWSMAGSPASTKDLSSFADINTVSSYAKTAMAWAVEKGLISGTTDTTIIPKALATRAQRAAIIARYTKSM